MTGPLSVRGIRELIDHCLEVKQDAESRGRRPQFRGVFFLNAYRDKTPR